MVSAQASIDQADYLKQQAICQELTEQNQRLEENTSQAASATSQLNSQLAEALAKTLQLEDEKSDLLREVEKLEEMVDHLQVGHVCRKMEYVKSFVY